MSILARTVKSHQEIFGIKNRTTAPGNFNLICIPQAIALRERFRQQQLYNPRATAKTSAPAGNPAGEQLMSRCC
ncbi:hypothetical protein IQ270_10695 [Microcoleus sp. LEGE 07076]|uniref:hypothetical protein n=1 Tax=Microcoleus sp. LEGE 07076 TaxID=915322 RepID=UPI001881955B|nr:hypothetical protein [Microcoleus sp. LEGE 07076]MBE9185172.1 hypothetical protein [Microcoleus sp. LEGE 07076]